MAIRFFLGINIAAAAERTAGRRPWARARRCGPGLLGERAEATSGARLRRPEVPLGPWRPGPAGARSPEGGSPRARAPREGPRKVGRCAGSASASPERRGVDSSARGARQRVVGLGPRPVGSSRSAVASLKPAAVAWADDRNGKGAHGVGAAQGQVPLGQHVGRVSQQAQPPPGARQCGPLRPTGSQVCVAPSRGQQPPASESPAGGRCGPHVSELSPPPYLLFLLVVLSLLGLGCERGRLPWLPDSEPSPVPYVQGDPSGPRPLLPRRNGFSAEGSLQRKG